MNVNNWGPFDATIWGTVSDWLSIVVNLGAAYLIYKTLRSQVAVQKLQQRVTEIEHTQFIKSLEPKFEIETKIGSPNLAKHGDPYLSFSVQILLPLTKNPAKNIKYTFTWPWYNESDSKPTNQEQSYNEDFLNYGDQFTIGLNVRVSNFHNLNSYVFVIKILIEYFDINDNMYSQIITVRVSNEDLKKTVGNPILINDIR